MELFHQVDGIGRRFISLKDTTVSHSHLSIRHFIQQLESDNISRSRGVQLPKWVQSFIESAAECFEPVQGSARAGYVCSCLSDGWNVQLFLGTTEVVGGPDDGANIPAAFTFNVDRVRCCFDEVYDMCVQRSLDVRQPTCNGSSDTSTIINGMINGQFLTLEILEKPPAEMGPAMLQHSDGRCELV